MKLIYIAILILEIDKYNLYYFKILISSLKKNNKFWYLWLDDSGSQLLNLSGQSHLKNLTQQAMKSSRFEIFLE